MVKKIATYDNNNTVQPDIWDKIGQFNESLNGYYCTAYQSNILFYKSQIVH